MRALTHTDYNKFIKTRKEIEIENVKIPLGEKKEIKNLQPGDFEIESESVWSFPDRGSWATHNGNYRGNWSPYIPRNIIMRYSNEGDIVLDQMAGSGTTLVECKLTGRNGIGVDINPDALMLARDRLDFNSPELSKTNQATYVGDARNLNRIPDNSIDLIATHPPYAFIIPYSNDRIGGDLSSIRNIDEFIVEMQKVAKESFRVLKEGAHCAILMGDARKRQHYIPITIRVMQAFLDAGFVLREDVIKRQWKMKSTREKWGGKYNFLKIAHEHLYVFRKLGAEDNESDFKKSMKWWS
ncbi:TRM11 family SAM-dependent methyltransferase [Candidatus Undinarchaeota archaeon]